MQKEKEKEKEDKNKSKNNKIIISHNLNMSSFLK